MSNETLVEAGALAFFKDLQPSASDFRADVLAGLRKPQKAISPKYFYDAAGSAIFDRITEAPEYYPTRTELSLLDRIGPELKALAGSGAVVLEPGAGSSVKIRRLLEQLFPTFVRQHLTYSHFHKASARLLSFLLWCSGVRQRVLPSCL